jgi:hypothetical protein
MSEMSLELHCTTHYLLMSQIYRIYIRYRSQPFILHVLQCLQYRTRQYIKEKVSCRLHKIVKFAPFSLIFSKGVKGVGRHGTSSEAVVVVALWGKDSSKTQVNTKSAGYSMKNTSFSQSRI